MVKFALILFVLLQFSGCGGNINHMASIPITARDELEKSLVARPALLVPRDAFISNQKCIQDITESKELVFKKGVYCFKGTKYNISTEGLFRIFDFQKLSFWHQFIMARISSTGLLSILISPSICFAHV